MRDALHIWTVYKHPKDCPDKYVARRSEVSGGSVVETGDMISADTLEEVRRAMDDLHLVCLMRDPDDDPVIVETWL